MKEPQKFSMSTGLPHTENDEEVKKYPLQSVEKELHDLIQDSKEYLLKKESVQANFIKKVKESKKKYNERVEKENKDST